MLIFYLRRCPILVKKDMENNYVDLYQECDRIVDEIPKELSNDQKLRRLYREVGKLLSKSPEFFYEKDPRRQKRYMIIIRLSKIEKLFVEV